MPAVVRVKRRIDEEPHSAFVLNGKKRRLENATTSASPEGGGGQTTPSKDEISTVLKFAGTIKEQDNTATTQFAARLKKTDAKELVQQKTGSRRPIATTTERARKDSRQAQSEQRFRVVNCHRVMQLHDEDDDVDDNAASSSSNAAAAVTKFSNLQQPITIVDIEPATSTTPSKTDAASASTSTTTDETSQNTDELIPADSDTGYVYDLYLPENEQQAAYVDMMDDNYLSVHICDDLVYEDCYNNSDDNDDEFDSEDSNQENYFTNDYPDEEDDNALYGDAEGGMALSDEDDDDEDALAAAVHRFVINDDDEDDDVVVLSSSEEDDDAEEAYYFADSNSFIHTTADDETAEHYGTPHARRHKRGKIPKQGNDDDDIESDDSSDYDDCDD